MNPPSHLTRREALKVAAVSAVSLPFLRGFSRAAEAASGVTAARVADDREHGLRLGLTSYSTRNLTLDATIETAKVLRLSNLALFRAHHNWETASLDESLAVGEKLRAAGLKLSGSGVVNLPNDETKARKAFENAKAAGMATLVCKPAKDAFPLVEKLAREFDQKLAIHNHGPEDRDYPTPESIWKEVAALDSRIGLCIDVGHTARAGVNPADAIRRYAARLHDVHMKDSAAVVGAQRDVPVEIGTGRLDIRGMLRALREVNYSGVVTFEYEKVANNPVTGLAESVGYVRGMLAALAAE